MTVSLTYHDKVVANPVSLVTMVTSLVTMITSLVTMVTGLVTMVTSLVFMVTPAGLVRKQTSFISGICDERGEELLYAGVPMSEVIKENLGVGGVISLLWFQRRMPDFAYKFIELCLIVTADHGPAVSGAHNTIVTARAGKDLVSSLTSGLLTIGDRYTMSQSYLVQLI